MRCSNCGEPIEEGRLFCLNCGQEVQWVPDYDSFGDYMVQEKLKKEKEQAEAAAARKRAAIAAENRRRKKAKKKRMILLKIGYRNIMLTAQLQFLLIRNTLGTVMKKTCNLCILQIITLSHGKCGTGVHNSHRMLKSGFIQIFGKFLFYLDKIIFSHLNHFLYRYRFSQYRKSQAWEHNSGDSARFHARNGAAHWKHQYSWYPVEKNSRYTTVTEVASADQVPSMEYDLGLPLPVLLPDKCVPVPSRYQN